MRFILVSYLLVVGLFAIGQNKTYKTENFIIHYDSLEVPGNRDTSYRSPTATHKSTSTPYYIQDMGSYLQAALDKYATLDLITKRKEVLPVVTIGQANTAKVEQEIIPIYVREIKDDNGTQIDGITSRSQIDINKFVPGERGMTAAQALQKTCTHELMHFVTMKHYSVMAAGMSNLKEWWGRLDFGTKWWWECLAVQGDRIVFPTVKPYEAEVYAGEATVNLSAVMMRSWDDCNQEPNWYASGGFLAYLMYYRPDKKAEFKELFFRPVKEYTSYIRTVLDGYVKSSLGSNGLGVEYEKYIIFNYEKKGFAPIDNTADALAGNPHSILVKLDDKFPDDYTSQTEVPYMAGKIFRLKNMEKRAKIIVVKNLTPQSHVTMYAYDCTVGDKKFLKIIGRGDVPDSLVFKFPDNRHWVDIVTINNSINDNSTPKISVIEKINAEGDYTGKVDFADDNTAMKSRYSITISNLHVVIDDKNKATGTVEFHMEYAKDGMLAVCSSIEGNVDDKGNIKCSGRVSETDYPKCKDKCCTYDMLKQNLPCFKVTKYVYWHFSGKVKISPQQKEVEGGIEISPSPQPKGGKQRLKYAMKTSLSP